MADVLLSLFGVADEGANGEMTRNKHTRDDPSVCRLLILSMEDPSDKRRIIADVMECANLFLRFQVRRTCEVRRT